MTDLIRIEADVKTETSGGCIRASAKATEVVIGQLLPRGFSVVGGIRLVRSFDDPAADKLHAEVMIRKARKFNPWIVSGALSDDVQQAMDSLVDEFRSRLAFGAKGGAL